MKVFGSGWVVPRFMAFAYQRACPNSRRNSMTISILRLLAIAAIVFVTALKPYPAAAQEPDNDRYIVKFAAPGAGKSALASAGATVLKDLSEIGAVAAHIPPQALTGLQNNAAFEYIEPDHLRFPLAETVPYGITMVQADLLSDAQAANRTVCIIDSGYDIYHEDLDSDGSAHGTNDPDPLGSGDWFEDNCGHGTHVAGTVSALANNGIGVRGVLGGGNVDLHIIKVFGDDCSWAYSSDLVAAAYQCRDAGADVINVSLGGGAPSAAEQAAFDDLFFAQGLLSVAAAGNDGNTAFSYPASYDSVVSVGAIDGNMAIADFSQQNSQVELVAPGVSILSTVPMGTGVAATLDVGGTPYSVEGLEGTPLGSGAGPLVDCGLAASACVTADGGVCLIQRGDITFADKMLNCEAGGGVGAVIYNNEPGNFLGTLGGTVTQIPSVSASQADGQTMLGQLGLTATVTTSASDYALNDGTSMATPHVSGVAALIWSYDTSWTNAQIRDALSNTAIDLGAAGRDNAYGFGLVQASAALDYLQQVAPVITLAVDLYRYRGVHTADLTWSGAGSANIDVYRDGALIATTENDGAYTDSTGNRGKGSYVYSVCEEGTLRCSDDIAVRL